MSKGFKAYCYADHKNNLFSEAQLGNRHRSKKMSNWALGLPGLDVVRVWIRDEATIFADAPSRAPWESAWAMQPLIPDMPVMYRSPEQLTAWVQDRKE